VRRAGGSPGACNRRAVKRVAGEGLRGRHLAVDGFNVLISVEAAIAGGVVFAAVDGSTRDLASVHGTYRHSGSTFAAIEAVGCSLVESGVASAAWLLDRPVSNSGRLAAELRCVAARHGWEWTVSLVDDPDPLLHRFEGVVASSDSGVLDYCRAWTDLAGAVIRSRVPQARILELTPSDIESDRPRIVPSFARP
jgi:hypothetical protein